MTSKNLSERNQTIFNQLERVVSIYPIAIPQLQQLILNISHQLQPDLSVITSKTQDLFKTLLMTILKTQVDTTYPDWEKKCGLPEQRLLSLKAVLNAICGGPASQKLKCSVVISFIENVLECLGVSDLTEVLDVISGQIPRFANQLEQVDQAKLLRVINVLLKTVSKTEDYYVRGQLHLALTRFLPLCHDSGFHFRAQPAKATDWEKLSSAQENIDSLEPGITYEFYEQFWQLQKWLMEPNEMAGDMTNKLKKIQHILKEVQFYFQSHPPSKENADYFNQSIKYLKNFNLLGLQMSDPAFRQTLMMQILLFTHALTHPLQKVPIPLTEVDKKIINEIQAISKKMLNSNSQGKHILEVLPKIIQGEVEWANLKEHWKDKKKTFLKRSEEYAQEELKTREETKKSEKEVERRKVQVRKLISEKMKIEGGKIQKFLQNKNPINLDTQPVYTSFSYFFSQAMNCLQSFDHENGKQTEFQTRAQYNMFEWKAMRSLYRQRICDIWSTNDKAPPKMKEYRLISLMNRNRDELVEPQPSKKTKIE